MLLFYCNETGLWYNIAWQNMSNTEVYIYGTWS